MDHDSFCYVASWFYILPRWWVRKFTQVRFCSARIFVVCLVVRDGQLREWTKGAIPLEFGSNNLISCYLHILHLPGCDVDDENRWTFF